MIIETICIIIFIIIIVGLIYIYKNHNKNNMEKISFRETLDLTNLPIITLVNNDMKLNFLIDTGSTSSHINKILVDNNVLDFTTVIPSGDKQTIVVGMEGSDRKVNKVNMSLQINNTSNKYNEEFLVNDLSAPFSVIKSETGATLHGILGVSFFDKYKYIIDFKKLIVYR